jgi:hypothetical protein
MHIKQMQWVEVTVVELLSGAAALECTVGNSLELTARLWHFLKYVSTTALVFVRLQSSVLKSERLWFPI